MKDAKSTLSLASHALLRVCEACARFSRVSFEKKPPTVLQSNTPSFLFNIPKRSRPDPAWPCTFGGQESAGRSHPDGSRN